MEVDNRLKLSTRFPSPAEWLVYAQIFEILVRTLRPLFKHKDQPVSAFLKSLPLDDLRQKLNDLFSPPFYVGEVFACLDVIGSVIKEIAPDSTKEEYEAHIREVWEWADDEFRIVRKLDDLCKLPAWAEIWDGPAFRALIERVAIPQLAEKLAHHVG